MDKKEFNDVIECSIGLLEIDRLKRPELYRKSGEAFEPRVAECIKDALCKLKITADVDHTPGGHGFPDIIIIDNAGNKFGVEVKSTIGNDWKINGNSILGSTRVPGIICTEIIFGHMKGEKSIFRHREYEKCVSDIVVTHSPRYKIDLDAEESFFERSGLGYKYSTDLNEKHSVKRLNVN